MFSPNWKPICATWANAVHPPRKFTPSEWAERHFVLPAKGNAEAGRFRFSRTPYLKGIVDSVVEPGVEDIVFIKPTRVGGTTAGQILLGYWADNDPGNCLTVMPSESAAEEEIKDRVRPLLATPALRSHVSPDPHKNTLARIELDTMDIYTGWAGSPQSLGSRTCKYVRFDEVDKYPPFAGREADPISLGKERTGTYGHRKRHYITSTPTTREGAIMREWEACGDKRHFYVPCPHCGTFQILAWANVTWPKNLGIADKRKLADEIETSRLAWYVCGDPDCKGRIEESHKPKMLERGVWISHDADDKPVQTVGKSGAVSGDRPTSKRIGFHLSSLYSPWRTFAEMAAEFIRAEGDIAKTMNFRNSRLAEAFEIQVSKREPNAIREKEDTARQLGHAGKRRIVPLWAPLLIALVDVQQGYVYWQIDAWGYELKSKRIDIGISSGGGTDATAILNALNAAYEEVFNPSFPIADENGVPLAVQEMFVDAKYHGATVKEFAQRDANRVRLTQGKPNYLGPIAKPDVDKASKLLVYSINTMQSKDTLDRLLSDPDPLKWQTFDGIGDEFASQLSAEHKILDPKTKQLVWIKKTSGAANHYWDLSANSAAIAFERGAAAPAPEQRQAASEENQIPAADFMTRGRKRW